MQVIKDYDLQKIINNEDFNNLFFLDLETYQFNEISGKRNPSEYKNMIFSLAISLFYDNTIYCNIYYNFYDFIKLIKKRDCEFKFFIHNGFKYDNHFLLWELKYYYKLPVYNLLLESENEDCKEISHSIDEFNYDVILQKRVKSKNNLDFIFKLNNNIFKFEDTFLKTNLSLRTISKKLNKLNLLNEDEMKTDFDYAKYNIKKNLSDTDAKIYAKQIFKNLSSDEKIYIYNDVIILIKLYIYFNKLFKNFDIEKLTLSQNILENYLINDFTKFQLLQKIDKFYTCHNSDYNFNNENLVYYLKRYYKGGLNFYNDKYIGEILNNIKGFCIDINSSYSKVMYNNKIPTFLAKYGYEKTIYYKDIQNDNYFYLLEISKDDFNKILSKSLSVNVTKMLVKYYFSKNDNVYINSNTLNILNIIFHLDIKKLYAKSFLCYECMYFGARELIDKYYFIKQQGKSDKKLIYNNALDIQVTKMDNYDIFNDEEIYQSKVFLNGIYGIPALRPFFNNFKLLDNILVNFENGFKNSERNLIFSVFVTSQALFNLLYPLINLSHKEIDDSLLYMDTDSLYFKDRQVIKKFPKNLVNMLNLGAFSYDCEDISDFYILNHKKYCYYDNVKKKIKLRCGGVPLKSFNLENYSNFYDFINNEFFVGKVIKNQKSILNKQGTISIYQSETLLDKGEEYPILSLNYDLSFLEDIKKDIENKFIEDVEYIETNFGAFSFSDLYKNVDIENSVNIKYLKYKHKRIKNRLGV